MSELPAMKVRLAVIEHLKDIVHESVKPLENIDNIKIVQVDGLGSNGTAGAGARGAPGDGGGSLSEQVVSSALRYRTHAPLIDSLMQEVGLSGADLKGLIAGAKPDGTAVAEMPDSEGPAE